VTDAPERTERPSGATIDAAAIAINPDAKAERVHLDDTSWVDVYRGWLSGAELLFEALRRDVDWRTSRLFRYDHWVEERRLGSAWQRGMPLPHPAVGEIHKAVQRAYGVQFGGFGMMQYRDGRDGQAFHRDTDMRWLDDTIVAILTLGAQRPWHLRPKTSRFDHSPTRGATHDIAPRGGDLHVMGGKCQADWEHSVPYLGGQPVGIRISLQWRFAKKVGRPFMGSSYSAPLTYRDAR
jgi:alkylated DNA repair dioxygenase AlkB